MSTNCAPDRIFYIKVDNSPSVFQTDASQIVNTDATLAYDAFGQMNSSEVLSKSKFYAAIHMAIDIFTQRNAMERRISFISCGNCLEYSPLETIKVRNKITQKLI